MIGLAVLVGALTALVVGLTVRIHRDQPQTVDHDCGEELALVALVCGAVTVAAMAAAVAEALLTT